MDSQKKKTFCAKISITKRAHQKQSAKEFAIMREEQDKENNNNNNCYNNAEPNHRNNYETTSMNDNFSGQINGAAQREQASEGRMDGRSISRSSSVLSSSDSVDELDLSSCSLETTSRPEQAHHHHRESHHSQFDQSSNSGAEDNGSSGCSLSSSPDPASNSVRQLNVHSNLVPETEMANKLVDSIRVKFLEHLDKQSVDLYEPSDLDELRKPLPTPQFQEQSLAFRFISRFVELSRFVSGELSDKDVAETVEKLAEFLKFRKQFQLPHIRPDQFCQELYLMHGIFPFGHDKQNLPVLYLRANVHRRWSQKLDESFRRYVAWQVDLITKSYAGAKVRKTIGANGIEKDGSFGICFDCVNVSYSCVDMDFLRFIVKILVNCYPTYCRYALCVDLPWLFRSVWKLVRSWLPEDAQNTVQLITSKQLPEFIDEKNIPNSIRIHDSNQQATISEQRMHRLPENYNSIRNFDEFARELQLSSSEIKTFKNHMEKVVKDYKQSGAIPESITIC